MDFPGPADIVGLRPGTLHMPGRDGGRIGEGLASRAVVKCDRLDIPSLFHSDPLRRRILIALNIDLVVQNVLSNVTEQNTERLTPVFDEENPIGDTGQMRTWYTTKPCFSTAKSHISHLVGDSSWEGHAANIFEKREDVIAYAKNDHLGFQIYVTGR